MQEYLRLPLMKEWSDVINASLGIYRYRWGDAPLRWATLHMLARPKDVARISDEELPYWHCC